MNKIEGVHCLKGDGTFYAFADFSGFMQRFSGIKNDVELAEMIIEKTGVALVPGSAFGNEGYMRLSFATSEANLDEAIKRLTAL